MGTGRRGARRSRSLARGEGYGVRRVMVIWEHCTQLMVIWEHGTQPMVIQKLCTVRSLWPHSASEEAMFQHTAWM